VRDIFLIIIFPFLLFCIFKRPYIGVSLWIWSAMFFPNGWVWAFASSFRYNLMIALATILSYFFQKNKIKTEGSGLSILIIIFFLWSTISSIITISDPEVVWFEWNIFFKIIIFYFLCIFTIKSKHHINVFIWAITLSAAFFGAAEGLKYIVTAGGHTIQGIPGSRLSDRNELALAVNMTLPLIIFLLNKTQSKWLKMALIGAVVFNIVAILGSYSRGGLIALLVIGGYFFWHSKRKFWVSIFIVISIGVASFNVSDEWTERMDSINTMEQDNSFLGRVVAWKQAILMASDHPFFGGGFKAGQNVAVWYLYEDQIPDLDFIIDTGDYKVDRPKAAHSIYFQVLGDQGFVGLFIFLAILFQGYRKLSWVIKNSTDKWLIDLAKMLKVSLLAYAAGGAALSLPYFDLSFAILALSHILCELIKRSNKLNNAVVYSQPIRRRQSENIVY
jgi:probable O-glycosylation ligase (exosortase A-associated)